MEYLNPNTGLIIFTHNKANMERPLSLVSGFINFFSTWKLKNKNHNATHTAQGIIENGRLKVIDSDVKGVISVPFEKWKEGRAWIHIFDPNVLTPETEQTYIDKANAKSGDRYGYEDIYWWLFEQFTGDFEGETNPEKADDNMLCIYFTQYLYNLKEWWKGSPYKLQKRRFEIFPFGKDLYSGKPEDVKFV